MKQHYLEPWCRKAKQSWALDEIVRYLLLIDPLDSKRTRFSTNLDRAKRTPAPCKRNIGRKRAQIGIFRALGGVPCTHKQDNHDSATSLDYAKK